MKYLSLFVDKWFITVAVNIDGNVRPLSLPNGEDRIWLFFHEDIAHNRIVYGKSFETNYRDKEPHYIGDVFPLLESGEKSFTRYDNRRENMREIFKVSSIFNHIHQMMEEDGEVETFISFSSDISDVARLKFLEELDEANFKVIESVARISHLALEESKKRGVFTEDGYYLALVATNDNLHYALYEQTEDLFIRKNEDCLKGYGIDVRRRALIESVVENVNRTTHFLSTTDDISQEYIRQDRYADDWLDQIANRRFNIPVTFSGVTFAVAPNNPYSVTIKPSDLDDRTNGIVEDIVRKIGEFVKANNVRPYEVKGIAFIGNTFTNQKFTQAINNKFILEENKIVLYRDVELPKVVSVYSQIDCNQFKVATENFIQGAKTQDILNKQAKEEEARRVAAAEEAKKQQELIDQQRKAIQDYENAIENVERYESDHDYEQMREWAEIALTHKPGDEYAKGKSSLAQQLLAEQRAQNKQYTTVLQRAKIAFEESRWSDAISQSEIALELRHDSDEAKRIKNDSRKKLEIKDKVTNFLNRADVFFAQKLYREALDEVEKVLNLDSNNKEAVAIKKKVSDIYSKQEAVISQFRTKLADAETQHNYVEAIAICDSLIDEDTANLQKWTEKKEKLKSKKRELEQNQQYLSKIKEDIGKASFNDDWTKLVHLCESYLAIENSKDISNLLLKAKKKIEEQQVKEAKENAKSFIKALIVDKKFNEADAELKRFESKYPSEYATVKDLRKQLFSFSGSEQSPIEKSHRQPIGFTKSTPQQEDDFFGGESRNNTTKTRIAKQSPSKPNKEDDFFDKTDKNKNRNYSNDDFNF
jgi:tetratricopeptide (TPR) repeat protein